MKVETLGDLGVQTLGDLRGLVLGVLVMKNQGRKRGNWFFLAGQLGSGGGLP